MFSVYFDESGTHSGSPVFVVAGLLSPDQQWEKLTKSWKKNSCA